MEEFPKESSENFSEKSSEEFLDDFLVNSYEKFLEKSLESFMEEPSEPRILKEFPQDCCERIKAKKVLAVGEIPGKILGENLEGIVVKKSTKIPWKNHSTNCLIFFFLRNLERFLKTPRLIPGEIHGAISRETISEGSREIPEVISGEF